MKKLGENVAYILAILLMLVFFLTLRFWQALLGCGLLVIVLIAVRILRHRREG